jgi:hypothetical protein
VEFAHNFPLGPQWAWIKFNLANITNLASVRIGVAGSKSQESLDIATVEVGYPAVHVKNNPTGITVERNLTMPADITVKQSFFSLWKSDTAQIFPAGDLIGLHVPQNVKTISLYLDNTLFYLHFFYPHFIVALTLTIAVITFRRPLIERFRSMSPMMERRQVTK